MKQQLDRTKLIALIDRFEGVRCTVYGDLLLDEFIYGDISRVSREAPVLILDYNHSSVLPGGGANSVNNIKALDAIPIPVGIVGKDEAGILLLDIFKKSGINTSHVKVEKGYQTPVKTRILAGSAHTTKQQIVRLDRGSRNTCIRESNRTWLRRSLLQASTSSRGLLVADYNHGIVDVGVCKSVFASLRKKDHVITLDSRKRILEFRGISAATPNEEEVERAMNNRLGNNESTLKEAGRKILKSLEANALLVTRGSKGMALFEPGKEVVHIPVHGTDEVADVTGAGDTVISTFTLSLCAGGSFYESAILANYAGGIVVMKRGTATVSRAELVHAIQSDEQIQHKRRK